MRGNLMIDPRVECIFDQGLHWVIEEVDRRRGARYIGLRIFPVEVENIRAGCIDVRVAQRDEIVRVCGARLWIFDLLRIG